MQVGFKKHGQSGIEVTDWWPHLAGCVDEISFVRSMWTTDNDHAAENQIHTGRHKLDESQPSLGAWAHYGLGSLNENLPKFVVLGGPTRPDTRESICSFYLGPEHSGVPLSLEPGNPLPYGRRAPEVLPEEQERQFALIDRLKPDAFLINTSRAEVVDHDALAAAVRERGIRVGLDVYPDEPTAATADYSLALLNLPGVYGTHHIGASTDQAQEAVAAETVRIVRSFVESGQVPNIVNSAQLVPR